MNKKAGVEQGVDALDRSSSDLILIAENGDRSSGANGHEGWLRIRVACEAPVLIPGRYTDKSTEIELLEMGADGYFPPPLDYRLLLGDIRAYIRSYKITTGRL